MIDDPLNRLKVKRGSDLPHAKLDEETVIKIRNQHDYGRDLVNFVSKNYTAKALAKRYGVHVRTIDRIISLENWTHV